MPTEKPTKNAGKKPPASRKTIKRPNQARSKARVDAILRAAENLLANCPLEEIGPYEIATEASVPPASVYYFFPSIDDLWAELTKTVTRRSTMMILESGLSSASAAASGWQSLFKLNLENLVNFYNNNPALAELILGPNTSREVFSSFDRDTATSARIAEELLMKYFLIPNIPKLRLKLVTAFTASEAIMRQSYRAHGRITDELKKESLYLLIAYMRTILPEEVEPREQEPGEQDLDVTLNLEL